MNDEIAPLQAIPVAPQYEWVKILILAYLPFFTRAVYALMNGRGLRGTFDAIWYGTNVPKPTDDNSTARRVTLPLLFVAGVLLAGCANLEPGGAYTPEGQAPDKVLYSLDSAYDASKSMCDLVMSYELNNEALLWSISPEIKHTLDKIRPQAWASFTAYHTARKAYLEHPTPAELDTLKEALSRLQQVAAAANAIYSTLPKGK